VDIREVQSDEYARLGALTVLAYETLPGYVDDPDYMAELYDVRTRAEAPDVDVLVAVDDDGSVLGGVTLVTNPRSPFAEHEIDGAAAIRMLAVDPGIQGRGIGEALVRRCIDRSLALGCSAIVLHSTPWMTAAHRLYERLGFERDESRDYRPLPDVPLLGFRLSL